MAETTNSVLPPRLDDDGDTEEQTSLAPLPFRKEAQEIKGVETSPSSVPSASTDPPPNGGLVAWLQVLGSFCLWLNSWGIASTFGVFQTYYTTNILDHKSSSSISWIGSTQVFLLLLVGFLSGPMYDAGYFRSLQTLGSILVVLGFMTTSVCKEYWQFILAQGICTGIGSGLFFVPSVAIITQYFTTKRAIANGVASLGSGIGGIIYPIIFHRLQPRVGFGWATRTIGFVALATLTLSLLLMRVRVLPPQRRILLRPSLFRSESGYALFCASLFFTLATLYIPYFYLGPYYLAYHHRTTDDASTITSSSPAPSANLAFYLVPIISSATLLGRTLPALLADRLTGTVNMTILVTVPMFTLAFAWTALNAPPHSTAGTVILALLYGFFSGSASSIAPLAVLAFCPSLAMAGTMIGMSCAIAALGTLVGPPIAGAILRDTGRWVGLQVFAGGLGVAALVFAVAARVVRTGWVVGKKL